MPKAKKKIIKKKSYVIQDSGNRGTNNYVRYKIPKYSKKNTLKTLSNIEKFASERSARMTDIPILRNADISVALKFDDGTWISTSQHTAGDDIDIGNIWEEYGGKKEGRKIVSFSFLFTV